jgi:hypothetical protein
MPVAEAGQLSGGRRPKQIGLLKKVRGCCTNALGADRRRDLPPWRLSRKLQGGSAMNVEALNGIRAVEWK